MYYTHTQAYLRKKAQNRERERKKKFATYIA
jgi:hypothetical protein